MSEFAYLGLGGNIGDVRSRFQTIHKALQSDHRCHRIRSSPLYQTAPWGDPDQPDFLNAVLELQWETGLVELVQVCRNLELAHGRDRSIETRWGPRPIDIDILLFGDTVTNTPELVLPHPRMADRLFVLIPLADLDAELIPPGWDGSIQQKIEGHPTPLTVRELGSLF